MTGAPAKTRRRSPDRRPPVGATVAPATTVVAVDDGESRRHDDVAESADDVGERPDIDELPASDDDRRSGDLRRLHVPP